MNLMIIFCPHKKNNDYFKCLTSGVVVVRVLSFPTETRDSS